MDELVGTESGVHVLRPHDLSKSWRDLDEHGVADVMTEGVVDVLEIVEVDERDDRSLVRRARFFQSVGERAADMADQLALE